jgi:hypothetical protein
VTTSDPSESDPVGRGASWFWWGLLAAVIAICAISVASVLMRNRRIPDRRGPPVDATSIERSTGKPE